jgi:hypothetical protein
MYSVSLTSLGSFKAPNLKIDLLPQKPHSFPKKLSRQKEKINKAPKSQ